MRKIVTVDPLDKLIPAYGNLNVEIKGFKKTLDDYNKKIKEAMKSLKVTEDGARVKESGDWIAKLSIRLSESMNEDKLIGYLKKNVDKSVLKTIIKKREYIDEDALENAIYNKMLADEIIAGMESCKESKETQVLTVTKKTGGKKN